MRQKRAKAYKKQMLVYSHAFKFREPYQILIDNEIILDTCQTSFDLIKGLKKTLNAEKIKPMITQCCIQALYEAADQTVIDKAKSFERRRCNHSIKAPESPKDCILSVVNVDNKNKHRYVVCSQNVELRRKLRKIPGVPIIHMNRSVMVMEPLSDASNRFNVQQEEKKLTSGLNDSKNAGLNFQSDHNNIDDKENILKRKRNGRKGPNPLSVKKKQKKAISNDITTENKDKVIETIPKESESSTNENTTDEPVKKKRKRKHHKKRNNIADTEAKSINTVLSNSTTLDDENGVSPNVTENDKKEKS
ncbi:related to rRNA-processing protein UTP23 [Saccharomycodes ludwigii]|uniref:U three protein 23 n=1 Tax=Saccharomycodes ludwigii TaxID=36035 RepID=A0A376B5M1_9ASCO|nr:related to rRNA-processing protein UTP23 [Saccharomycodes ludwigii]